MISDVLFEVEAVLEEAERDISDYLEDDTMKGCYQDREILGEIVDVLGRIRALRIKLDTPTGADPPESNPTP